MIPIKVLVPSGVLGLGFDLEALNNGVKNNRSEEHTSELQSHS